MTVIIQNDQLIAKISEHGAELISLKSKEHDLEYIWQGDPKYWGRHAPFFPIVGRLKNDQYVHKEKRIQWVNMVLLVIWILKWRSTNKNDAKFVLKRVPLKQKRIIRLDFELVLVYELGETGITVHYQVENIGEEEMYFSIGGHPAFNVPLGRRFDF